VAEWTTTERVPAVTTRSATVVVDATALSGSDMSEEVQTLLDELDAPGPNSLRRVVHVVPLRWLGRALRPADAGRAAFVVAAARARALRAAPARCTVNVVVVPDEFPDALPPASAPIRRPVGAVDLAHVVRYLLDPANDYVTGQVLSICGGDDAWSNGGF
jgi:hypothetical protein